MQDDALEETGWKLVHGDVFRPPRNPTLLVACVGSGIQLFCMVLIVLGRLHTCNMIPSFYESQGHTFIFLL